MKALIVINAYTQSQTELNQPNRLACELELLGCKAEIRRNDGTLARIEGGEMRAVSGYDFCVYFDKDDYCARMLEGVGLRLFNSARAIALCDDKMLTHIALSGEKIAMPTTVSAPLCYYPNEEVSQTLLAEVEQTLGYPLIVKECFGSLGKGVHLAKNREELLALAQKFKCKPHLFQAFIQESKGRDLRVIAVGGEVVASMERRSSSDFRSNVELGGEGIACPVSQEIRALAKRVATVLDLDFCGIDFLFGKDGYLLCEVNSNAFFGGIERVTGVNVAKRYAEYILRKMAQNA